MMMATNVDGSVDEQEQDNIFNDSDDDDEDLSNHHRVPFALNNMDWHDLNDMIYDMDSGVMNEQMREEIRQEKQILLSIRQKLKKYDLILRGPYKGDGFHLFQANAFHRKASKYMKKMKIYSFIRQLNGRNPQTVTQACLANIVDRVETILDSLRRSQCINDVQHTSMDIFRSQVQLSYLYFVPDTDKTPISVRPIVICNNGPTMRIADYLAELFWTMLDQVTHCQKFAQGADVIQALELYAEGGLLQSTTLFATFTMDDIATVFPYQETIEALEHFLDTYAVSDEEFARQGMTIETIIRLVRLVLENQFLVYNNKLYRQTAGGASGSPLTMPLAYIYLFHWKSTLMTTLMDNTQEIFGRHQEEAFLTWNGSKNQLRTLFKMSSNKHHHCSIRINASLGSIVHFMDAYLSHKNGIIDTKVHQYPTGNHYTSVEIPSMSICSGPQSVRKELIRAALCCSNVNDFTKEENRLTMAYISRGLSTTFVQQCLQWFFIEFGLASTSSSITDADSYQNLRRRVREYQQGKQELKKKRAMEEKNMIICKYPVEWDAMKIATIKQALNTSREEHSQHYPEWKKMQFELTPRRQTPLSLSDYLIDKKPPIRLLTLSDSDLEEESDHSSGDDN